MAKDSSYKINSEDYKRFVSGIFYPLLLIIVLWIVKLTEFTFNLNFTQLGLFPRTWPGLIGIVTGPLIHSDINHLFSNSVPLLILGAIMFYFYKEIAFKVFFWIYLMTGLWVWAAAREAYHLGASGLIYGFLTFLFFSGVFRKDKQLLALTFLVTFIYGGLVWGMLPVIPGVSWESHALGALAGLITAFNFRNEGPQPVKYQWEEEDDDEEEEEDEDNPEEIETLPGSPEKEEESPKEIPIIRYTYSEKDKPKTN